MLTEKLAIEETKELWRDISKSGLNKYDFLHNTSKGHVWLNKTYNYACPLCTLAGFDSRETVLNDGKEKSDYPICCQKSCPLFKQYNMGCFMLGYESEYNCPQRWFKAIKNLKEN
jgi:hypothetical protein